MSTGCAGALAPELVPGDLAVASAIIGTGGERFETDATQREQLRRAAERAALRFTDGPVLCSPQVLATVVEKRAAAARGAIAVEMEGAPIAASAAQARHPVRVGARHPRHRRHRAAACGQGHRPAERCREAIGARQLPGNPSRRAAGVAGHAAHAAGRGSELGEVLRRVVRGHPGALPGARLLRFSGPVQTEPVCSVRMSTFEPARPSIEYLARSLEFETLLADLSARFVSLPAGEVDREIEDALRRVCEPLGIDLAVLWQWSSAAPDVITPTHAYDAQGAAATSRAAAPGALPLGRPAATGRPHGCHSFGGGAAGGGRRRPGKRPPSRHQVESDPPALGGGRAARWRPGLQYPEGGARLAGRAGEAAATGCAGLHQRARPAASRAEPAGERGSPGGGRRARRPRVLRGGLRRRRRLRRRPASATSAAFPRNGWRASGPWSSGWSICIRTTASGCWTQRQELHDGRLERAPIEYRFLHPAHGEKWLHHVARVARRDASGHAVKTFGVLRDITEQRQREEALRQSYAEIERLKDRLQAESDYLKAEIKVVHPHGEVTGQSPAIQKVLRQVEQVAPTDSSVLVRGETGTGKELVAQAIHRLSPRRSHLMIKVNCAALPSGLVESELFGREKGAFTGALTRQIGRFEVADGSTLFLDEIGELSLEVQAKLLRVLEAGEFERLGSPRTIKVDVRVIAATNRDLAEAIRKGRFREDLYYRLNVFPIRVPPLRERAEDIPLLVWAFLEEFSSRMGKKITQVPRKTMEALQRHPWPGNVRELRNVIEHGAIITTGETLRVPMLDETMPVAAPPQTLADAEREHILRALESAGWHIKGPNGAAAVLGLNPSTLYSRMKKLGIRPLRTDGGRFRVSSGRQGIGPPSLTSATVDRGGRHINPGTLCRPFAAHPGAQADAARRPPNPYRSMT